MGAGSWLRGKLSAVGAVERRPFGRRITVALIVLVALIVVVRVVLDPIATYFTRRELNAGDAMRGDLHSVHMTILPPGYEIRRLKVVEHPADDWAHPLVYVEHLRATVSVRDLLHARLSAKVRLDGPKITISKRAPARAEKKPALPDVRAALDRVIPARVDRIEARGGELLFRDLTAPRHPEIWLHGVELSAENLATRRRLARGRPATVSASARLGRSGDVTLFASANLFTHAPDFAGNLAVRGWKLAELYDLEEPRTKLQTPEGTLDLFAEFKARDGAISGGVKPVLENVKVRPTNSDFGNKLKAWVADESLHLFSDRVPDRNAVATVVPIEGRLDQPDIQLWPTILGVVRNAFVEGISSGFAHLPPPASEKKEGALTQAKHALEKKSGPPKAQPAESNKPKGAPAKP
jgi:hypothetical protein